MSTQQKKIDYDGTDVMSRVLTGLLNQFPGMSGVTIEFSTVSDTSGIGIFPTSGAAILEEKEDITGHVKQMCAYPFNVLYRAALHNEGQKLKVKEFLDTLARWLERQPVNIGGSVHQLTKYPEMPSGCRVIKSISRTSPSYLSAAYDDKVEDWIVSFSLKYENEFDR